MKARNFRYIRPASLEHAYRILAERRRRRADRGRSKPARRAEHAALGAEPAGRHRRRSGSLPANRTTDGAVRLGALTRHCELLRSELVQQASSALVQAAAHIGHVAIRNRGTLGGSLAYADPAAELPACAVALGATLVLGSSRGEREVKAEDFFKGLFETDLRPGELIVAVKFPVTQARTVGGFRRAVAPARRLRAGGPGGGRDLQRGRIEQRAAGLFRLRRPRQGGASGFGRGLPDCGVPLPDSRSIRAGDPHRI